MSDTSTVKLTLRSFDSKILYMNGMYKLPIAPYPTVSTVISNLRDTLKDNSTPNLQLLSKRLRDFHKILVEEADEIKDIDTMLQDETIESIEHLTAMADLLGDIVVYCYSEAAKFGIPLSEVLSIIMDSNFSKLDTNGQPIYDERGKVQKGPFYWKPEPKIKELLLERIKENTNG